MTELNEVELNLFLEDGKTLNEQNLKIVAKNAQKKRIFNTLWTLKCVRDNLIKIKDIYKLNVNIKKFDKTVSKIGKCKTEAELDKAYIKIGYHLDIITEACKKGYKVLKTVEEINKDLLILTKQEKLAEAYLSMEE